MRLVLSGWNWQRWRQRRGNVIAAGGEQQHVKLWGYSCLLQDNKYSNWSELNDPLLHSTDLKLQYQVCPKSGAVDWPPLLCPQCSKRADLLASIKSKAYGQASEVCVSCFSDFSYLNMQQNLNFLYIKKCIMLNLMLSQKMCLSGLQVTASSSGGGGFRQ